MHIRSAKKEDLPQILEIYDYYVRKTAITYEEETPTPDAFCLRWQEVSRRYPWIVSEENGMISGFAYASPFHVRSAYRWAAEVTIYVAQDKLGRGLGRALYRELEKALREMGILNLYACIAYPQKEDSYLTTASADFHAHMGYRKIGCFRRCAFKFGRWYDMIWMEKQIGRHDRRPAEPVPFPERMHSGQEE